MALTYTINDIQTGVMHVDIDRQLVTVEYREVADGVTVKRGVAYFHVALPANPTDEDFLLPPAKVQELLSLRNDSETAIANRLGVEEV